MCSNMKKPSSLKINPGLQKIFKSAADVKAFQCVNELEPQNSSQQLQDQDRLWNAQMNLRPRLIATELL